MTDQGVITRDGLADGDARGRLRSGDIERAQVEQRIHTLLAKAEVERASTSARSAAETYTPWLKMPRCTQSSPRRAYRSWIKARILACGQGITRQVDIPAARPRLDVGITG